jgi:hypothetical protein
VRRQLEREQPALDSRPDGPDIDRRRGDEHDADDDDIDDVDEHDLHGLDE